jgi:hypothetical protein
MTDELQEDLDQFLTKVDDIRKSIELVFGFQ